MKKQYLFLILAIVVALVVIAIEKPYKEATEDFSFFLLFPDLKTDHVSKIEITHLIGGVTLSKKDNSWFASPITTEAPSPLVGEGKGEGEIDADPERIKNLLEQLGRIEATSLVSQNPEKQTQYQVNAPLAKQVKVYDDKGNLVAQLYIGKTGLGVFSTYVRKEGSNDVYTISEFLNISADANSWRKEVKDQTQSGDSGDEGTNSPKIN